MCFGLLCHWEVLAARTLQGLSLWRCASRIRLKKQDLQGLPHLAATCMCVCVCACVRVRACVRGCVCVCAHLAQKINKQAQFDLYGTGRMNT